VFRRERYYFPVPYVTGFWRFFLSKLTAFGEEYVLLSVCLSVSLSSFVVNDINVRRIFTRFGVGFVKIVNKREFHENLLSESHTLNHKLIYTHSVHIFN
jgi:hypothetical protein